MAKERKPTAVMRDIELYLQQDPRQLQRFHEMIEEFKSDHASAATIYPEILRLLDQNPELCRAFRQVPVAGCDIVSELAQSVQRHLQLTPELLSRFSHLITLFIDELVPVQFLDYEAQQLTALIKSDHRRDILGHVDQLVHFMQTTQDLDFLRRLRKRMQSEPGHAKFVVAPDLVPQPLYQLVVMASFACPPRQVEAFLHALDLYACQLMPIDGAFLWIRPLHPLIAKYFEEFAGSNAFDMFFPSAIYQKMRKSFPLTATMRWILGEATHKMLSTWPANHQRSLFQMALDPKSDLQRERNPSTMRLYVAELQASQIFKALKNISASIQAANGFPVIPDAVVKAVFGHNPGLKRDHHLLRLFIQRALEKGRQVHQIESRLREEPLNVLIPSSADWRCMYRKKIHKSFVLRSFLFVGFTIELPSTLNVATHISAAIAAKFGLVDTFRGFTDRFERPETILEGYGALAVFYFCQLVVMIDKARDANVDLCQIPNFIEEMDVPLAPLEGYMAANADLVLKYFARNLKRAGETFPQQFTGDGADCCPGEFLYILRIQGQTLTIRANMNGIRMLN
jgi:hypothetical protein